MNEGAFATAAAKSVAKQDQKRKAGRPSKPQSSTSDSRISVQATPEQAATLAEWGAAKKTTPEALLQEAFEELMERVDSCVGAYRRKRDAFDAETVVEIEREIIR